MSNQTLRRPGHARLWTPDLFLPNIPSRALGTGAAPCPLTGSHSKSALAIPVRIPKLKTAKCDAVPEQSDPDHHQHYCKQRSEHRTR